MSHARVISEWFYNPDVESNQAKIEFDFNAIHDLSDLIEHPDLPSPNIYVGFIGNTGNGILTQIKSSPDYGAGCVLLEHHNESQTPTSAEFNEIRNFLLTKLKENPPTVAQVDQAIGTSPNGRTRWDISQALIAWVKSR